MMDLGFSYDSGSANSGKIIRWPNGARVAVLLTVNIECWNQTVDPGKTNYPGGASLMQVPIPEGAPDWGNYTWREYGLRVGIWRIVKVLDKYQVKPAATLNTIAGKRYPKIIEEANKRGWEFTAHCRIQNDSLLNFSGDPDGERDYIKSTLEEFEQVVGKPAQGWISPSLSPTQDTLHLLAEAGLSYCCDFMNDDQPFMVKVGDRDIVAIPTNITFNDYDIFTRHTLTNDAALSLVRDTFDILYEEGKDSGKLLNIGIHLHVTGQPARIRVLDEAIKYMKEHENVWFATRAEIADWFRKNYS